MSTLPLAAIIYGSDTGNTENVAHRMSAMLQERGVDAEVINVTEMSADLVDAYEMLIMGIPTWDFGGIQQDWEELEAQLPDFPVREKFIALYGLGDQIGYGEYFLDAVGWLYEHLRTAGAYIAGSWPTDGYDFEASRALEKDGKAFVGLALDEDSQPEFTDGRIDKWLDSILQEYKKIRVA